MVDGVDPVRDKYQQAVGPIHVVGAGIRAVVVPGARRGLPGKTLAAVSGAAFAAFTGIDIANVIAALRVGYVATGQVKHQAAETRRDIRVAGVQPDFYEVVGKKTVEPESMHVSLAVESQVGDGNAGVKTPLPGSTPPDNNELGGVVGVVGIVGDNMQAERIRHACFQQDLVHGVVGIAGCLFVHDRARQAGKPVGQGK